MNDINIFNKNKDINEMEIMENKIIIDSMPRKLVLVPTTKCNLKCIMCSRVRANETLEYSHIKKLFPILPYLETFEIQGGEPFLLDYFDKLIDELISNPNVSVPILTNGLLIDNKWADLLVNKNISLSISVDSVIKEKYEFIRRGANFNKLLNNIELINNLSFKRKIQTISGLCVVVMKCNYKELHLFPEFCKKYNIPCLRFDYLRPEIIPEEDIFTIGFSFEIIEYLKRIFFEIECKCKELDIHLNYEQIKPFLKWNSNNSSKNLYEDIVNERICHLPWKKLFIEANGDVRPDCLCDKNIGNLKYVDSIEFLWNNELMQTYRQNIVNNTVNLWCSKTCLMGAIDKSYRRGN